MNVHTLAQLLGPLLVPEERAGKGDSDGTILMGAL